jgi:hypothetical protein
MLSTIAVGQLPFDAEAPALLVGVVGDVAQRTVAPYPTSFIRPSLASGGLDQSVGERIAQVQVRRRAVVLIGGDGGLVYWLKPCEP